MVASNPGSDLSHYYDSKHDRDIVKIKPGEFFATTRPFIIATVLGSCVAACIRDPIRGTAGMNHFMLPEHGESGGAPPAGSALRYGSHAMEALINEFIKNGSQRRDLEAKIFGGAAVVDVISAKIGAENAAFVVDYLKREGIRTTGTCLGGFAPRRVLFFVEDGRVLVKYLRRCTNDTIERREAEYAREIAISPLPASVELFYKNLSGAGERRFDRDGQQRL
jgi:chemotaxis protein CheD